MAEVEKQARESQSAPEPRRARWLGWLLVLVVPIVAAGYIGHASWQSAYVRPYEQLRANLHEIQLSIERFAVDNEGSYPHSLRQLIADGYIVPWPENPFQPGEPMPVLAQGEAPLPGGVLYIPTGYLVALDKRSGLSHLQKSVREDFTDTSRWQLEVDELDQYVLIGYVAQPHNAYVLQSPSGWFH